MLMITIPVALVQTPKSPKASYFPASDSRPMEDILKELRLLCEEIQSLRDAIYSDLTGGSNFFDARRLSGKRIAV